MAAHTIVNQRIVLGCLRWVSVVALSRLAHQKLRHVLHGGHGVLGVVGNLVGVPLVLRLLRMPLQAVHRILLSYKSCRASQTPCYDFSVCACVARSNERHSSGDGYLPCWR
jgi:hypothetical protein